MKKKNTGVGCHALLQGIFPTQGSCVCIVAIPPAPHYSTLAWKIPWAEEPRGLQSTGSQRVGHDWATSLSYTLGRHTLWKMFLHSVEFSTILMISFEAQKPLILIFGWTYVSVLSGRYSRVELLGHTSWGTVDVCLWLLCFSCHT